MFNSKVRQQKQILTVYQKKLNVVHQYCKTNTSLNHIQKQRLSFFLNRSITFCRTQKVVRYEKNCLSDVQAVISNQQQYASYRSIHQMLHQIVTDVTADVNLTLANKIELSRCLSYTLAHIVGKLNRNQMYYTSSKEKVNF